jgi:DNA-binding MurR/RpiR family transcriptional regulator
MPSVEDMFDKYDMLTRKQRMIFDYLIANPNDICYISLKDLSQSIKVSEVSILRLCRTLGFEGYTDLKEAFRKYTQQFVHSISNSKWFFQDRPPANHLDRNEMVHQICRDEERIMKELVSNINPDLLFSCARILLEADETILIGYEASGILAEYFAHRLNFLRIRSSAFRLYDDRNVLPTVLSQLNEHNVVVLFSFPPYNVPINNIARFVPHCGAKLITITDSQNSPAITNFGYTFFCNTDTLFFFNSMTTPISLVGLISSCIAYLLGSKLDEILAEEQKFNRFMEEDPSLLLKWRGDD